MSNSRGMWELFDYGDENAILQQPCLRCVRGIVTYVDIGADFCSQCGGTGFLTLNVKLPARVRGSL